jgi:hypothetical protein
MRIEEELSDDVRILRLSGELDATDVPEVTERLDAAGCAWPRKVVLNLERVQFATVVHALGLDRTLAPYASDDDAVRHLRSDRDVARPCVPLPDAGQGPPASAA